jgi:hypothetical protein
MESYRYLQFLYLIIPLTVGRVLPDRAWSEDPEQGVGR